MEYINNQIDAAELALERKFENKAEKVYKLEVEVQKNVLDYLVHDLNDDEIQEGLGNCELSELRAAFGQNSLMKFRCAINEILFKYWKQIKIDEYLEKRVG